MSPSKLNPLKLKMPSFLDATIRMIKAPYEKFKARRNAKKQAKMVKPLPHGDIIYEGLRYYVEHQEELTGPFCDIIIVLTPADEDIAPLHASPKYIKTDRRRHTYPAYRYSDLNPARRGPASQYARKQSMATASTASTDYGDGFDAEVEASVAGELFDI